MKTKQISLNYLFHDFLPMYAHLLSTSNLTKEELKNRVKQNYSLENPRNLLFFESIDKSEFETIKISSDFKSILFNQ